MHSLFLPAGLLISFLVAWLVPAPGLLLKELGLIPWTVIVIFLVNGYQTKLSETPKSMAFVKTLLCAGIITLMLAPLMGGVTAQWLGLSAGMALGLVVKSAVPSTLSTCIVMTQLAGGNPLWALVITVVLNLVGVFTIPLMLSWTLADLSGFELSPWHLLLQLVQLVLIPFIVGLAARQILSLRPDHIVLVYLPSVCVILAVWMSLSASSDIFQALDILTLGKIVVATFVIHFGLMGISLIAARIIRTPQEGIVALLLTGSQKTLPVAVSVLAALNQPIGEAILLCVLFHFIQLFADAALVPRLKRYAERF